MVLQSVTRKKLGWLQLLSLYLTLKKIMARKGDIDSKSVAARVPMDVYLDLLRKSSSNKKTLSSYLCDILSNENLNKNSSIKKTEDVDTSLLDKISSYKNLLKETESQLESCKEHLREYKKKYNQETFSSLMRDLRDKELKIEQQEAYIKDKEEHIEKLERHIIKLNQ